MSEDSLGRLNDPLNLLENASTFMQKSLEHVENFCVTNKSATAATAQISNMILTCATCALHQKILTASWALN